MFLSCDYSFYNQQKFYFLCLFNQLAVMKLSFVQRDKSQDYSSDSVWSIQVSKPHKTFFSC